MKEGIETIIKSMNDEKVREIATKTVEGKRLNNEDALVLYKNASLGLLGALANFKRENIHSDVTYFNRNFHIEPTNKCVFDCKFCSYSRKIQQESEAWELSEHRMLAIVEKYKTQPVTEVHIVGGVHPKMNLQFFATLIQKIKTIRPDIHVKAFTAVELEYMFRKAKVNFEEGLKLLKDHGMNSLPGGGAEIFDETVREIICADKASSQQWLDIHETAHQLGMPSNCTMLYGQIESYENRIDHMNRLRELQDRTGGFNAFIPLKFRNQGNEMSYLPEINVTEDLRCYAMARIFLDNIKNIKAYWPMIGKSTTQLLLDFGVNDIDGTIDDTTKIYSMAGAEDQNPSMNTEEMVALIKQTGRKPIERDSVYNHIKDYSEVLFETVSEN